ncbi:MAG: HPr family phosphocarrier protein [Dorea sp.]|nr:HPr family phosphocarrier protein [Dorea sp.]
MLRKPVTILNSMEMENRPIAHLVQEASKYRSQVYIEMENKKINAKSIMGMMSLTLLQGTSVIIAADGMDEEAAVAGMERFLTSHK